MYPATLLLNRVMTILNARYLCTPILCRSLRFKKGRIHIPEIILKAATNQNTQLIVEQPASNRQPPQYTNRIVTDAVTHHIVREILHARLIRSLVIRIQDPRTPVQARAVIEFRVVLVEELIRITQGRIGIHRKLCRRILHHHVHSTPNGVSLQVWRKGFEDLQPVQHLRREYVQRNIPVLIVGTRDLDTIDQCIDVALVHAPDDNILSFPIVAPLDRYP